MVSGSESLDERAANLDLAHLGARARALVEALEGVLLGQEEAVESLVAGYMAGGHVLLEGVPGLGKTLLARAFASALGLDLSRIQFTPDLMPADVVGTHVFDRQQAGFRLVRGPIFTQILMADEINRTPPKTQSALLEAMEEGQVTIDGTSEGLPQGFFVIATQNPLEFEGIYPLPEAQLDRFVLRIDLGLPRRESELEVYRRAVSGELVGREGAPLPTPVLEPAQALALRRASRGVHVAPELLDYLADLVQGVRSSRHIELGVSPRGALALLETARARAALAGRDFATPDDFKASLFPCWRHRLILGAESELEGHTATRVLAEVAAAVEVPR